MTPSPEDLTDLGVIAPFIVLINFILGAAVTTSPRAGKDVAQSKVMKIEIIKRERIFQQ
jgi:hypothetical protein